MDRAYTPDRSPIEQLEAAAEQYLRFYLDQPEFFHVPAFPAPLGNYPAASETAERLARRVDEQNARMVDAIERGIAEGSIRPLDGRKAATILWASWNGVISLAWRPDELREDERSLADLLSLAADMVKRGTHPIACLLGSPLTPTARVGRSSIPPMGAPPRRSLS